MSQEKQTDVDFMSGIQRYHDAIRDNDVEAASNAIRSTFATASRFAIENPTVTMKLTELAKQLEAEGKWNAAEDIYTRILAITGLDALAETQTYENLGVLAQMTNRDLKALEHARQATAASRRSEMSTLLSISLLREASCLIRATTSMKRPSY